MFPAIDANDYLDMLELYLEPQKERHWVMHRPVLAALYLSLPPSPVSGALLGLSRVQLVNLAYYH